MRTVNIDVALTLKVSTPDNLAMQYRQLPFTTGNVKMAKLSAELPNDDDYLERILNDNIRHVLTVNLPQFLEAGGFGVRIIPLALQRANIEELPTTAEIAAEAL